MKLGIIVYSETGHTSSVINRLVQRLNPAINHQIFTIRSNEKRDEVYDVPNIVGCDTFIIATPVQAFMPATPMVLAIKALGDLTTMNGHLIITHYFKRAWLGGNHTIKVLTKLLREKGANIKTSHIISWSHKHREQQIETMIAKMSDELCQTV